MRLTLALFAGWIALLGVTVANAESGKTLASTLDVYVFPKAGQAEDQQSKDEAECYEWAVDSTDHDPFELQKQGEAQAEETEKARAEAQQSKRGAGARGALRGAAAGALIGEIVNDDAGEGAAVGGATGAIGARRRARQQSEQAVREAEQKGQAQQEETTRQLENFKKAFSVCLEAKDYLAKY